MKRKRKKCSHCKKIRNSKAFTKGRAVCRTCRKSYQARWFNKNREYCNRRRRKYHKEHRVAAKFNKLLKAYNITQKEYNKLLRKQNNRCAICRAVKAGGKGAWHVDHDHETKQIRGLLCHYCNLGLGQFKDSTVLMAKAIKYLNSFRN